MYGLTPIGFTRKPYTSIISDKEERARDLFGEDIELSERSPLGLYLRALSWEQSKLWDMAEQVYYSAFIDDAEGKQLDGLVKYIGLFRKPALRSLGHVEFRGRAGRTVPYGTRVMTESGIIFQTTVEVTLNDEG
ncbi:MAG: baseplate J/gp47 family protein, partial [Defluviitaleaceae bacterium]|nr:baseplate J/gp47 family protein [Defluviitaleaceae bacterium]